MARRTYTNASDTQVGRSSTFVPNADLAKPSCSIAPCNYPQTPDEYQTFSARTTPPLRGRAAFISHVSSTTLAISDTRTCREDYTDASSLASDDQSTRIIGKLPGPIW